LKTLVVYDSLYGNTKKIAEAIGGAITGDVRILAAADASVSELKALDCLIAGSPTTGGRATPAMRQFLDKIPNGALDGVRVAAFDTRLKANWVKLFGFAAGRISGSMKSKGGNLVLPPQPFLVKATTGPLVEGEIERAAEWAKKAVNAA